jgi:hypothetical protein
VSAALLALADPAGAPAPAAGPSAVAGALAGAPAVPAALPDVLAAAPSGTDGPPVLARSEPARVTVPALGVDTGPIPLGLRPDGSMEVPPDAPTVGWFTGAPTPGERGPAVLAAHVDWAGRAGAFAELHTLAPGDEIRVRRADGATVVFVVERVGQYPKDRFPTDEVYGDLDHAGLRLITCGGRFDSGARSYSDNVVVFASLRA